MSSTDQVEPRPTTGWNLFKQQQLSAWQPSMPRRLTLALYFSAGLGLFGLGAYLLHTSQSVAEYIHDYTEDAAEAQLGGHGTLGSFDIKLEQDMQPPIWVYYQLENFHQNHRRYVKSLDPAQLSEGDKPTFKSDELGDCGPWVESEGRVNYPCGLIARSVFNDSFAIVLKNDSNGSWKRVEVNSSAETIAWPADLRGKFQNVNPEASAGSSDSGAKEDRNDDMLNMWILERFPPETCEQQEFPFSTDKPYHPAYVATRERSVDGIHKLKIPDCSGYMTDSPSCRYLRDGAAFTCDGPGYKKVRHGDWGIESGHFIVWMRIAGLPTFRKLWGRIDTTLSAGSSIRVYFQNNFPVSSFKGRKSLVLSESSALGGRNDFLGYGYMIVGVCCWLFGLRVCSSSIATSSGQGANSNDQGQTLLQGRTDLDRTAV